MASEHKQAAGVLWEYRNEPVELIRTLWPDAKFWRKQSEIIRSVVDNFGTIVHSGIETGKGYVAARIILWFYATRFPCKVIATSVTQGQLKDSLWGEIDAALRTTVTVDGQEIPVRQVLGIDKTHMELRRIDPETKRPYAEDWVRLRVARDVEGMHGVHLPPLPDGGPSVLVVLDECSGVGDEFCEGLEGQAHVMLAIANPLNLAGWFARKVRHGDEPDPLRQGRLRWHNIHIDAARSPNVSAGRDWDRRGRKGPCPTPIPGIMAYGSYLAYMKEWDNYNRTTRIHGNLPDADESRVVVPQSWLDRAFEVWWEIDQEWRAENLPRYLGVDASHLRNDPATWFVTDALGVVDVRVLDPEASKDEYGQPDTVKMLTITQDLMREYDISPGRVAVDAGGGGQTAIGDPLRGLRQVVQLIDFGAAASRRRKRQYKNRRAELYGLLAERCNPARWRKLPADDEGEGRWERCWSMPSDGLVGEQCQALADELTMIPKYYDREGKMYLPSKDKRDPNSKEQSLTEILGHSPDRSDGAVLSNWAMVGGSAVPVVSRPLVLTGDEPAPVDEGGEGDEPAGSSLIKRVFGKREGRRADEHPWQRDEFWEEDSS